MNSRDWLVLSILTFLTIVAWTVYDVYHKAVASTLTAVQKELSVPLTPDFDEETLVLLKKREV